MFTPNNLIKFLISLFVLFCLLGYFISKCKQSKNDQNANAHIDNSESLKKDSIDKAAYNDTINFLRGQLELQKNRADGWQEKVTQTEKRADVLISKHKKMTIDRFQSVDGGSNVLVPNEFVQDCDTCFSLLETYKDQNKQYQFERDSYDSILRIQSDVDAKRIIKLESDKDNFKRLFTECLLDKDMQRDAIIDSLKTRKLKISIATISIRNNYIPNGIGGGLIYEDKKENEFGLHGFGSAFGPVIMANAAKTITFRRKRK